VPLSMTVRGVEHGVVEGEQRPAIAVPAGMGQLQADEQIIRRAERLAVGGDALVPHPFEVGRRLLVEEELARVGAALVEHRRRLAPDELGPAGPEAAVAAKRQLVWTSVEGAVAAFHRLHAQGIAGGECADGDGAEQRTQVVAEAEVEAETAGIGFQFGHGVILEEASQGRVTG